jgi:arylsulfatase A-like enzyme
LNRGTGGVRRGPTARAFLLLVFVLVGGAAVHAITTPSSATTYRAAFTPGSPPNVLFIVTDDQRPTETLDAMPKTRSRFGDRGTYFPNAFTTTPLCCPSRASIFTGRYAHNHRVRDNSQGWLLDQRSTIQRRLREAGYTTALFGKFLNNWDLAKNPPYFDKWSLFNNGGYTNFPANEQGQTKTIFRYATNYVADKASEFIRQAEGDDERPWFLYVAPTAPHGPFTPEPKYEDVSVPKFVRNPAFFEADLSDKPPFVQQAHTERAVVFERRTAQLRMLMSVDDLVARVFAALGATGETDNTLAFFISDNGYIWGEHGLVEKRHPYTHSVKIPFYMRWPGRVRQGAVDPRTVANIDLAPTVMDAAGLATDPSMDGMSLLQGGSRDRILMEVLLSSVYPTWASIRTHDYQYTEYYRDSELTPGDEPFFREYYDLVADPWQRTNFLRDGNPSNNPPPMRIDALHRQLVADLNCAGRGHLSSVWPACP